MIHGKGRDRDRAVAANRIPNIWLTGAVCDSFFARTAKRGVNLKQQICIASVERPVS